MKTITIQIAKLTVISFVIIVISLVIFSLGYVFGMAHGSIITQSRANSTFVLSQIEAAQLLRENKPDAALNLLEKRSIDLGIAISQFRYFPIVPSATELMFYSNSGNISGIASGAFSAQQHASDKASEYASRFPNYTHSSK